MEYILLITIVALLVERFVNEARHAREREDLLRAVLSRDATEYASSKVIQEEKQEEVVDKPADFTPVEDVDINKFMSAINGTDEDQ